MADRTTTIAICWLITLTDTTVMGFTGHDAQLTVAGQVYKPSAAIIPTSVMSNVELSPDNMDLYGVIDDSDITTSDLIAGRYDYATIEVFTVDWTDTASGRIQTHVKGKLGKVSMKQNQFQAELNNLAALFASNIGEIYAVPCSADLGDDRCKIDLDPDVWLSSTAYVVGDIVSPVTENGRIFVCSTAGTSDSSEPTWDLDIGDSTNDNTVVWVTANARTKTLTVTGVTDNLTFFDSVQDDADGYFDGGLCTWLTGNNVGYEMDIKTYLLSGGAFVLYEPMPFDVQVGDTARVSIGCDKSRDTCKTRYNNLDNHRGFPDIPGAQKLLGQ